MTENKQLPACPDELMTFVLVSEEKVSAMRAQIRAIQKANLAKEVYEQKLAEAQDLAEITLEAGRRMGELLLEMPTHRGKRTDITSSTGVEEVETKKDAIKEMGLSKDMVSAYQRMAQNPEAIKAAIEKAIERGDIVSRAQVLKEIKAAKEEGAKEQKEKTDKELADTKAKLNDLEKSRVEIVQDVIEVIPDDYEDLKKKAEEADRIRAELEETKKALVQQEPSDNQDLETMVQAFVNSVDQCISRLKSFYWLFDRQQEMEDADWDSMSNAVYRLQMLGAEMDGKLDGEEKN